MLLFGVCINDIEKAGINLKKVSNLLQEYDADFYKAFCEDIGKNPSGQDAMDWFSNYETEGRSGIVVKYGYAVVEAETDAEAVEKRVRDVPLHACL